ncbi:hypothetical protein A0H81_12131 [Grifola frondosa]|uniref:Secreted protein n=1 Tax=Grifola frondosa TaxID=5627 RepID=A0A1C7LSL6_GRIFR|nr:hypothetical protein A0H81_12131 [Grifola frondosa]
MVALCLVLLVTYNVPVEGYESLIHEAMFCRAYAKAVLLRTISTFSLQTLPLTFPFPSYNRTTNLQLCYFRNP